MRAKGAIAVSAMAIIRLPMLAPSIATTISPMISDGNESSTSIACMTTMSKRPPT